jgi:hypothetical protein
MYPLAILSLLFGQLARCEHVHHLLPIRRRACPNVLSHQVVGDHVAHGGVIVDDEDVPFAILEVAPQPAACRLSLGARSVIDRSVHNC